MPSKHRSTITTHSTWTQYPATLFEGYESHALPPAETRVATDVAATDLAVRVRVVPARTLLRDHCVSTGLARFPQDKLIMLASLEERGFSGKSGQVHLSPPIELRSGGAIASTQMIAYEFQPPGMLFIRRGSQIAAVENDCCKALAAVRLPVGPQHRSPGPPADALEFALGASPLR